MRRERVRKEDKNEMKGKKDKREGRKGGWEERRKGEQLRKEKETEDKKTGGGKKLEEEKMKKIISTWKIKERRKEKERTDQGRGETLLSEIPGREINRRKDKKGKRNRLL